MRKNNFFNIRPHDRMKPKWVGETGVEDGYSEFSEPAYCIKAWLELMTEYRKENRFDNVHTIVLAYCQGRDDVDVYDYINYLCKELGLFHDERLTNKWKYARLAQAMARYETDYELDIQEVMQAMEFFNIFIV
jgi:hypothetical protein